MKFTDKALKNLKPKDTKYYIHGDMSNDRHGFAICIYPVSKKFPTGTKSWFFIYRYEGKRCFLSLGHYPTVGLAEAAKKFDAHWKIYESGKNPGTVEEDKKAEREAAPTIKELGEDYIKRHAMVEKKSWKEDLRILEKEIYPAWGRRKAADITKGNIISLLDKVVDRGSPQTANNIFKIIRKMFNFAVKKDRLKVSPCTGIDMPAPMNTKERALSVDEVKAFWDALDGSFEGLSMSDEVKEAIKLILLTAQRPAEVSGMHTKEIEGNWWTIPAERAKNKKAHRVYLSPLALMITAEAISRIKKSREIPEEQEYSGFIFPCPHKTKEKPIERHALSKALKRHESEDGLTILGIANFTPHDLRRTAATFMAESGEHDEVIDAVLNHAKQGIIKVYNLYRYDKEKQAALESWGGKLEMITIGQISNVKK